MTALLLARGASWREEQGFGSDVIGTLSWASVNEPSVAGIPDWSGCARVLVDHGLPQARRGPSNPESVLIDARSLPFSDEVAEILMAGQASPGAG